MKPWHEWSHLATRWYQMKSGSARWTIVVAIALLVGVLLISQRNIWSSARIQLLNGRQLTLEEMGAMQVAFGRAGLNDYEIEGNQVVIPRSERAGYLKALADHGAIPPDLASTAESGNGLEFLQTRTQQRQRMLDRKKQSIRDMVQQMSFVQKAIVDYDEARGATPFDDLQRTAIVTIKPVGSRILEFAEIKAIRDTVRGAVAGLLSNDVTVIDINANRSWVGVADSESGDSHPHAARRAQEERQYENKIRSALSAYPGIRVNVEVAVDPVLRRVRDERTIDGHPVTVTQTVQRETSQTMPASRPTTPPQEGVTVGTNRHAQITSTSGICQTQRETQVTEAVGSGSFESIETAGLTVTDVRVSIGIPERCVDYFIGREKNRLAPGDRRRAMTPEQNLQLADRVFENIRDDIRQKVGPLIPGRVRSVAEPAGIVVTIDPDIPLDDFEPPAGTTTALPWWAQWQTAALISVLLGAAFWLRPLRRKQSPGTDRETGVDLAMARGVVDSGYVATTESIDAARTPVAPMYHHAGDDMRQELDSWCRENPEAAAATIRQWLDRRAG